MKFLSLFLFAGTVIIISCKDKKQRTENKTQQQAVTVDPAKDSAEIRTIITSFYNWYNTNYTKLMKYDLYSGIKKEDEPPYKINWNEVEKYQQFIRDSIPQLGNEFLGNQKIFFEQCDSAFKKDLEDDIPYGFGYDWYTNSQEDPQYLLDGINSSAKWIINIKGNDATVEIGAPEDRNYVSGSLLIQLNMKKENGGWRIAKIGND
ncbi:MAG: hypothetical protein HOP10_08460 [Chitinophagaceae bacterium]|nr:hypothetical protein [Chitinophagaceae bacterium]